LGQRLNGGKQRCVTGAAGVNVSYFARIVSGLRANKKNVIGWHGFSSLLLFKDYHIPMPLTHWIADHVDTQAGCIIVKNKFIPLSSHTMLRSKAGNY
jgi:hypothetical protein